MIIIEDEFYQSRIDKAGRYRIQHEQLVSEYELAQKGAFEETARFTRKLLEEAKALAPSPRGSALVVLLEGYVASDAAAADGFESYGKMLEAALDVMPDAEAERRDAASAWKRGSLNAKTAAKLHEAKIATEAKMNFYSYEIERTPPRMPSPALKPAASSEARGETEQLASFHATHGVLFEDEGARPPIDVVAIARRQGRDAAVQGLHDKAALWLLHEARELEKLDAKKRAELEKVFAIRAKAYRENKEYGEYAR